MIGIRRLEAEVDREVDSRLYDDGTESQRPERMSIIGEEVLSRVAKRSTGVG